MQEFQTTSGTQTQTRSSAPRPTTPTGTQPSITSRRRPRTKRAASRSPTTTTSSASAGSKGQTYEVFSQANTTFDNTSGTNWRGNLCVDSGSTSTYAAQFAYDSVGRATDVYKLQKKTTTPWTYVQTHTTYASSGTPAWGEASSVVEDYGGIGRTTTTNAYTTDGKADDVTDAAGHEFVTSYDEDGVVQSVTRTDCSPHVTLVSYTYGSSGLTNGMPTAITDGLSSVSQSLSYASSGGGVGQVASVTETNGSDSYTCSYTYDGNGDRASAHYSTPAGDTYWRYDDYVRVGAADSPKYAFQTLTKTDSSNDETGEAFHYYYDGQGRLEDAAFAQTPYSAASPRRAANPYYDSTHPANSRARAFYTYDPAGRLTSVNHWWDTWNYSSSAWNTSLYIVGNGCSYETSGTLQPRRQDREHVLHEFFGNPDYGLDREFRIRQQPRLPDERELRRRPAELKPNLDVRCGRKSSFSDYTGSSWTYDNLNRMTANGVGHYVTNDILGNRTALGSSVSYSWDCLEPDDRLQRRHRDVLRLPRRRNAGHANAGSNTDRFRYDGQMPIETVQAIGTAQTTAMAWGLGGSNAWRSPPARRAFTTRFTMLTGTKSR